MEEQPPEQPPEQIPAPPAYQQSPDYWGMPAPSSQFMQEALVRQSSLCQTELKPFALKYLDDQSNSVGFREDFKKVYVSAFDQSKILSRLKNETLTFEESSLLMELRLNMGKTHWETFDLDTANSLTLHEDIMNDYQHFITGAVGGDEREKQSKVLYAQEASSTQVIKDMRAPGKGKRFFGLFG